MIANHWNSKGGDQPLFGRFQPPARSSEVQRNAQAQLVHDDTRDVVAAEFADQTSDHDPLVARVCADVTAPSLVLATSARALRPPNHKLVTVRATVEATDGVDPDPVVTLVSAISSQPDDAAAASMARRPAACRAFRGRPEPHL